MSAEDFLLVSPCYTEVENILPMFLEYFYWQYIVAPRWLAVFFWRCQQVAWQFFSVPLLVKTLFAHWHRDAVSYHGGIGGYMNTFLLNLISRAVGFVIRAVTLSLYLVAAIVLSAVSAALFILFLLAPLLILSGLAAAIVLLLSY